MTDLLSKRDPITEPVAFARETIVAGLLCLADPNRRANHRAAAGAIAEAVNLMTIAVSRELDEVKS